MTRETLKYLDILKAQSLKAFHNTFPECIKKQACSLSFSNAGRFLAKKEQQETRNNELLRLINTRGGPTSSFNSRRRAFHWSNFKFVSNKNCINKHRKFIKIMNKK